MTIDGETLYRVHGDRRLAERVTVPSAARCRSTDDVPLEQAALLGCAALTGVGAVLFAARVEPGAVVLVIGAGGVGQFCVQGARIAGAAAIVVVDPLEARRDAALAARRHPGTSSAGGASKRSTLDYALRRRRQRRDLRDRAPLHARSGGTCVIVGMPAAGERLDLDRRVQPREKFLTGTMYGSEDPAARCRSCSSTCAPAA